jgi:hypothetical protein
VYKRDENQILTIIIIIIIVIYSGTAEKYTGILYSGEVHAGNSIKGDLDVETE